MYTVTYQHLVSYSLTNIYRIWNLLANKVISTRNVIFNEEELFSSNIEAIKADYLYVRLDELQQLLLTIEELDLVNLQPSAIEEDNEVYLHNIEAKEEAKEEAEEAEEEEAQLEEFPYTSSRFEPYPTPSLSPEAALLAGAIQ